MNFDDSVPLNIPMTRPYFSNKAKYLNKHLKKLSNSTLKNKMNLSDKLLNNVLYMINSFTGEQEYGRHALFAYRGTVFKEMDALSFDKSRLHFTQNHFRILSALYGVLKPFDSIEEYRLDMKTNFRTSELSNLYNYWKKPLTDYFSEIEKPEIILNLASSEFAKMINFSLLETKIIDISFGEMKGGKFTSPPMYSKIARGKLSGYIIRNKVTEPEQIKSFNSDGYTFNVKLSNDSNFLFTR